LRIKTLGAVPRLLVAGSLILAVALSVQCGDEESPPAGPGAPASPAIYLSNAALEFQANPQGSLPPTQTVNVTARGGQELSGLALDINYAVASGGASAALPAPGWLVASLSETTTPSTASFRLLNTNLNVGTYYAAVTVSADSVASKQIDVTCVVEPSPTPSLLLSRTNVGFNAVLTGPDPPEETVTIENGGVGTLAGLTSYIEYAIGYPTGWLTATLDATTAPTTLRLNATTAGLSTGAHYASVTIESPVASNSPRVIAVSFMVSPPPPPPPPPPYGG